MITILNLDTRIIYGLIWFDGAITVLQAAFPRTIRSTIIIIDIGYVGATSYKYHKHSTAGRQIFGSSPISPSAQGTDCTVRVGSTDVTDWLSYLSRPPQPLENGANTRGDTK